MFLERVFPFIAGPKPKIAPDLEERQPELMKKMKIRSMGMGLNGGYSTYIKDLKRANFEESPYDMDQIIKAIDTDSYVKQAFLKYQDLFWKESWDIVSENPDAVSYCYQRMDMFELTMGIPFGEFMADVADQLVKFSNVFIAKVYGDDIDGTYRNRTGARTLIGYYIVPAETVQIRRDKNNKVIAYKQAITHQQLIGAKVDEPVWMPDEMIHLYLYKKPGYVFGTPFIVSALDDVIALRQIEQDIQNLVHRELFPLYKYRIGLDGQPAQDHELEAAARELENLRVDGGLVLPERHDVEVIGAGTNALDAEPYLDHFKERVATGLGMSPHHLGMNTGAGNRAMTQQLDTALYDRVKKLQEYYQAAFRLHFLNEILREGGFNPLMSPQDLNTDSDRCYLKFKEIDIDTQIKRENHIIQKFVNNLIDWREAREELGLSEDADPNLLNLTMTAQIQTAQQVEVAKIQAQLAPKPALATGSGTQKAPLPKPNTDGAVPSIGPFANQPNPRKGPGNRNAPANQYGRRLSPNVRHSQQPTDQPIMESLDEIVNLLGEEEETGEHDG